MCHSSVSKYNYFAIPGLKFSLNQGSVALVTADIVIKQVCIHFKIDRAELMRRTRRIDRVNARYIAFILIRNACKMTLKRIGDMFSVDHTTVIHGIKTMNDFIATNDPVTKDYKKISQMVSAEID